MCYVWAKGRNDGLRQYTDQHQAENNAQGRNKSREGARDGMRRAAGPYCRNDPEYLDTWLEWACGSTPSFGTDQNIIKRRYEMDSHTSSWGILGGLSDGKDPQSHPRMGSWLGRRWCRFS